MSLVRAGAVVFAAALTAFAPVEPIGASASTIYRDARYKFSLKRFDKWEQVPVQAEESYVVAKFYEPGSKGDVFRPELDILRMSSKEEEETPVVDAKGHKIPKEILDKLRAGSPKTIYEAACQRLINFDEKKWPESKNSKPVKSKDEVDGKLWAIEIPFARAGQRSSPDNTLFVSVFGFEKDGVSYGARLTCAARRRDEYEGWMKTIARSFLFEDEKAGEVETLSILDGLKITPERRKAIEEGLVKGWKVILSPQKQYVVIYNTKGGRNEEVAKLLAERIEKIREQVYEKQFPPAHPIDAVSVMRVCADAAEYHAYGGPGGTAGYWNSGSEELVFYKAGASKRIDDDTLAVCYHEAFHQYIFYSVGSVAPHSWFNEGHGDYYAGAKFGGGKFTIKPFRWRIGVLKTAIGQGRRPFTVDKDAQGVEHKKWGNTGYTPLKDLVAFSQADYYAYPSVSYAQGWSLIYFLREEVPHNKKWNEKWGHILTTYFDTLKGKVNGTLPKAGVTAPDGPAPKKPGEPGKPGDPGEPGEPGGTGGTGDEPSDPGLQPMQEESPRDALDAALKEAFKGVDFDELEEAWLETMKRVN